MKRVATEQGTFTYIGIQGKRVSAATYYRQKKKFKAAAQDFAVVGDEELSSLSDLTDTSAEETESRLSPNLVGTSGFPDSHVSDIMDDHINTSLQHLERAEADFATNADFNDEAPSPPTAASSISSISHESYDLFNNANTDEQTNDEINEDISNPAIASSTLQLMKWAVCNGIRRKSRNEILQIIKNFDLEEKRSLPKDFRTLFSDRLRYEITEVDNEGSFAYFGISYMLNCDGIYECICNKLLSADIIIELSLHVDGVSLFHSSPIQFYPVLGNVFGVVFIIGVWCGASKPTDSTVLLQQVVSEICYLKENGIDIRGRIFQFDIKMVCADAPARSLVLKTKGHSGYSSCIKCWTYGVSIETTVYFPDSNAKLRTNEEFRNLIDDRLHHGESDLSRIPDFDFINQVPNDYMHSACLGVQKKYLQYWLKWLGRRRTRLCDCIGMRDINNHLRLISDMQYCPSQFARHRPRTFHHLKNFKATEFRQILLYTGPVIFMKHMKAHDWKIYINLHVIFRMLSKFSLEDDEEKREKCLNFTTKRLKWLIRYTCEKYGSEFATFNLHSILHLPNDCRHFGGIDNFSCFIYESFLYKIKRSIHTGNRPLQQLINRYTEYLFSLQGKNATLDSAGPTLSSQLRSHSCSLYHRYLKCKYKNMLLRADRIGNSFVKVEGNMYVRIEMFLERIEDNSVFIEGFVFTNLEDLFTKPVRSRKVGTVVVSLKKGYKDTLHISLVHGMCYPMPKSTHNQTTLVLTELLHKDASPDDSWQFSYDVHDNNS